MQSSLRNGIIGFVIVAVLSFGIYYVLLPTDGELVQQARRQLAGGHPAEAESIALSVTRRSPSEAEAWILAGEAAADLKKWQISLEHCEHVTSGTAEQRSVAAYGRGEACVHLQQFERAEKEFRQALALYDENYAANRRLADLLVFTGRRQQARQVLEQMIGTPPGAFEDLILLADLDHLVSRKEEIFAGARDPQADPLLVIGAGFQALQDGRDSEAAELFEAALKRSPTHTDALAGWGLALFRAAPQRLPEWRARLTPQATEDADVMSVLSEIATQQKRPEIASRLAARVVALRPTSRIAWHRLGTSLSRLGRAADAERVLQRARELQELGSWMDDVFRNRGDANLIRRVTERVAEMGRTREAVGWGRHAQAVAPLEIWPRRLQSQLATNPQSLIDIPTQTALDALVKELAAQPVAEFLAEGKQVSNADSPAEKRPNGTGRIRFIDRASATGLDFVHHSARDASTPGSRIIETTGGGVGVLDYDLDGWPDLYFTQGCRTFPMPEQNADQDKLVRNLHGQAWGDVSAFCGIRDTAFGQGLAVGDFDNDGFPDLYVGNYGVNALYQNQGDGTFLEVTPTELLKRPVWTSSCMIVDLNRDGWPDLFDATYCRGTEVETRLCQQQGVSRSCSPRVFGAEADRVWLNGGDGTWELAEHSTLNLPAGLGLGVVAFRPTPESPLGIFVANDEEPNFWLINTATNPGDKPVWEDRALTGGVAVDAEGQAQACMGVACDDANGDGWPDLFVTNFYHESNTLYLATSDALFEDQTRVAGLRDPSWSMLGFGTQFIDADLDGWPDLLVANGHIDDLSALGEPFEMPPQCFQNLGGKFRELPASEAGECFARRALGRGLARLDWNRDGREDAVVVNQDSPASLLTNDSETTSHSLILQFRATNGARDAIGTIVRVHLGSRVLTRQLTAGDGFQASNERQLVIGLGEASAADNVEIFWPDGAKHEIKTLAAGKRYILVQGGAVPYREIGL